MGLLDLGERLHDGAAAEGGGASTTPRGRSRAPSTSRPSPSRTTFSPDSSGERRPRPARGARDRFHSGSGGSGSTDYVAIPAMDGGAGGRAGQPGRDGRSGRVSRTLRRSSPGSCHDTHHPTARRSFAGGAGQRPRAAGRVGPERRLEHLSGDQVRERADVSPFHPSACPVREQRRSGVALGAAPAAAAARRPTFRRAPSPRPGARWVRGTPGRTWSSRSRGSSAGARPRRSRRSAEPRVGSRRYRATGSVNRNVVLPAGVLSAVILPPCASTSARVM